MNSMHDRSSSFSQSDVFANMLYPVKVAFLKTLPAHVAAFEGFLNLSDSEDPEAALSDLAARAHKITGVAETLSFRELGRLAAHFETQMLMDYQPETVKASVTQLVFEMKLALNT